MDRETCAARSGGVKQIVVSIGSYASEANGTESGLALGRLSAITLTSLENALLGVCCLAG